MIIFEGSNIKLTMKKIFLSVVLLLCSVVVFAQPKMNLVKVEVTPDHADWLYECGEKASFKVSVRTASNAPVDGDIYFEISEDMLPALDKGNITLKGGEATIKGYTMRKPGFLRCRVWKKENNHLYEECATVGFSVDKIKATTLLPDDFKTFWAGELEANKKIEMLPQMTLIPERCTSKVDVYSARFQSFRKGAFIYGTLCVPKNLKEKAPAILIVPGAGCRARQGFMAEAERGVVTFEIGIHGISTTMFNNPEIYDNLRYGGLYHYYDNSFESREKCFYRRVYVGCARAIDFLAQLDFVDEERIAVTGGSQGGALTIVTSYLNPKVKYAAAIYPAMCDLTGRLEDQGDAWPYLFRGKTGGTKERIEACRYYDVVNFARHLSLPMWFTYGYNDMVVCPTSMQACYNAVTAPKELLTVPQSRHYTYPEQREARREWLLDKLLKK